MIMNLIYGRFRFHRKRASGRKILDFTLPKARKMIYMFKETGSFHKKTRRMGHFIKKDNSEKMYAVFS